MDTHPKQLQIAQDGPRIDLDSKDVLYHYRQIQSPSRPIPSRLGAFEVLGSFTTGGGIVGRLGILGLLRHCLPTGVDNPRWVLVTCLPHTDRSQVMCADKAIPVWLVFKRGIPLGAYGRRSGCGANGSYTPVTHLWVGNTRRSMGTRPCDSKLLDSRQSNDLWQTGRFITPAITLVLCLACDTRSSPLVGPAFHFPLA